MRRTWSLSFLLISCALLLAPTTALAQKTLTGTISTNTTLDTVGGSIYRVTGTVTVNAGVTLTIDPGVVLKFDAARDMNVNGTLLAIGGATPDSLIYFTSIKDDNAPAPLGDDTNGDGNATVPNNRDWGSISFFVNSGSSSTLRNCVIRFGGSGNRGSVDCTDSSPTIAKCDIFAAYYGVRCLGIAAPVLRDTQINAMLDVPIAIQISANPVFDNLVFESTSDNAFDAIGLLGSTLTGTNRLSIRGATLGVSPVENIVYILLGGITIANSATLTVQPGVVIKPKNVSILVDGTLIMNGTADPDSAIVMTSFKDDNVGNPGDTNNDGSITFPVKGDWGNIEFRSGSSGSISYANLKFGNNSVGSSALRCVDASPTIDNVTISDCGIAIEQRGSAASPITNCSISNTTYTPFRVSVTSNFTYSGNTFTNVGLSALGLVSESIGVNSVLPIRSVAGFDNISYWMDGQITVTTGNNVRIEPGAVIKMNSLVCRFIVEGSLTANATVDSMTVFTSVHDDAYGNPADTQGNGTATSPNASNWGYFKFEATSDDVLSILDHCVIAYGGWQSSDANMGVVWCQSASPTISNCQFITNSNGVRTDGTAAAIVADNDFFNCSRAPLVTSVISDPQYSGNTFNQNNWNAIVILPETLAQDAFLERIEVGVPQFPDFFPYLYVQTVTIGSGVKLTVQPGVNQKMEAGVRPFTVNGALDMSGTGDPDSLIIMTSIKDDSVAGDTNTDGGATSPASGNWSNILFNASGIDNQSVLDHCLFRFGGSTRGVVEINSASLTIQNCEFEINTHGLWLQNASNPVVSNNLFRLIDRWPVAMSVFAEPIFSGNVLDNNTYDILGIIGEPIGQDLTIRKWDFAGYTNITRALVNAKLSINIGATLTIDPGIVIKMGVTGVSGANHFTDEIEVSGALVAQGTMLEPIIFTSIRDDTVGNPLDSNNDGSATLPTQNNWQQIEFFDISDDPANILEWCELRYGGWQGQVVNIITASPTINNCRFDTNTNHAIRVSGSSQPIISACTFSNHLLAPITMSLTSDPVFSGNIFESNNGYHALGILGETLASDVTWKRRAMAQTANIPYILEGDLTAGLSSILRIQPGVVIKPLGSGVDIIVNRGFIAEGKADPESLIVFTSPRDDFYGGDTNNDGTLTDGSSFRWGRILINNAAIDDSTRFKHCVFRYATTTATSGALEITDANPQIDNCIFTNNTVALNYKGAAGDPVKGHVNDCDIFGNSLYGIRNTGMSFTIDAQNNWWGHASGPLDASDDTGSGGFYNPGGLGDEVTDRVDYTGYGTSGVQNILLGDVTLNGEVRAFDSSQILQELAALITLSPLQLLVADVNCSGAHSTLDASLILRYVAGLDSHFPCAYTSIPTKSPVMLSERYPGSEDGDFSVILTKPTLSAGATTVVPIGVAGSGELLGHQYTIAYDPAQMTVEEVRLLPSAEGSLLFWNATEEGELRIALASAEFLPVTDAVEIQLRAADVLDPAEPVRFELIEATLNEQLITGDTTGGDRPSRNLIRLDQNHPNPFNPKTRIDFSVPGLDGSKTHVRLFVYDIRGRVVRRLIDGPVEAGAQHVFWNGTDEGGQRVASGVYIYRMQAAEKTAIRKMMLIK